MPLLPSFGTPRSCSSHVSTSLRVRGSEQNSRNGSATCSAICSSSGVTQPGGSPASAVAEESEVAGRDRVHGAAHQQAARRASAEERTVERWLAGSRPTASTARRTRWPRAATAARRPARARARRRVARASGAAAERASRGSARAVSGRARPRQYASADERARPHGAQPDRVPRTSAERPHGALQLALRAPRGRRVPAADREHRHEPRGCRVDRPDPGVAALARPRCDGEVTFQLDRLERLPSRWRSGWSTRARRTRTRARSGSACPTRASPPGTTSSAAGSRSRTRSSRTSCSSAPTAGRPTTSPRRSRTVSTGSRT